MAIFSVIKYDGDPDVFAWKYPDTELGTWTQLIVNESQQAILFKGGQALDVFEAGRHTLETKNIPFLEKLINIPFGGDSPFSAEVWFVNKVFNLDVKWGTPTPIQILDSKYNVMLPVRSHGVFGMRIGDPKKFLVKLVGTLPAFRTSDIQNYFRGLYVSRVKDAISTYILEQGTSVLEVNMYLDELSEYLHENIADVMQDYGVELVNFYVSDISVFEGDPAVISLRDALSRKAEMDVVGFNYTQQRSFDTLESAASNPGSMTGDVMGAGMGMGMGFGLGAGMGGAFSGLAQNLNFQNSQGGTPHDARPSSEIQAGCANSAEPALISCPKCQSPVAQDQRFCQACGFELPKPTKSASRFCHMCGEPLLPNARFCASCGVSVGPGASSVSTQEDSQDELEQDESGKQ